MGLTLEFRTDASVSFRSGKVSTTMHMDGKYIGNVMKDKDGWWGCSPRADFKVGPSSERWVVADALIKWYRRK